MPGLQQRDEINAKEGIKTLTMTANNFFGITDIGLVRKSNQDRYLIKLLEDQSVLLAVADGLGGEAAGDYAAEILTQKLSGLDHISIDNEQPELAQMAWEIDRAIYTEGKEHSELEGMGTTLIGVLLRDRTAYWVHVGDSRLYHLRDGALTQVTEDQTLARFLLEEGEITAEQLPSHYSQHVMDQCVGCGYAEPQTGCLNFLAGDLLVLTSDGLHGQISENIINSILNIDSNLEKKAKALVKAALDAGGKDNITIVMAQG